MKNYKALIVLIVTCFIFTSCFEDNDDDTISASQINDFVYKGMNAFYLYKDNIPNLENNRFATNGEYADYLNSFSSPEELFESLIYQRQSIDRFSWIVDDYIALEQFLNGITTSNGMESKFYRYPDGSNNVFGVVDYVLPNTSAESQGILRGDIYYAIDDTQLTINNFSQLASQDSYSINLGTYETNGTPDSNDDTINPLNEALSLTKSQYEENPIYINDVFNTGGKTIGYLMYNGFNGSSSELNDVFNTFKNTGITDLVLDLRYNRGGFASKAVLLSSLITGQFNGQIFSKEQWNSELHEVLEIQNPEQLLNRFINSEEGLTLNSLNLSKVYILTTEISASASELVINSLNPYIDVVQIGTNTSGKYQASITLYDSPNFGRQGASPNHSYAMQPLVFKSANVNDETDFFNGLSPDIEVVEQINNLGVLGDTTERLLAAAIDDIIGTGKSSSQKKKVLLPKLKSIPRINISYKNGLYSDKELPNDLLRRVLLEQN